MVVVTKNYLQNEFGLFFKENYTKLFYCALDIVGDEEWAKDIVGAVFGKAWEQYDRLRDKDLDAYLYISVRNRAIDHVRRKQAMIGYHKVFLEVEKGWHEAYSYETDEEINYMFKGIEELPERERYVFKRCQIDGKRYAEVAEELGLSASSVHKYMVKAFSFLREKLKKCKKG
ncbi:MAG: sigma-70 family RNA polymerase sigma factor [Bacteroidales bacterium]|nr:sigma-70 family RNA polymerase sigma factor [Bacteroidales bacterium]